MALPLYSKLKVDGVLGAVYDEAAVHEAEFSEALSESLGLNSIKTLICNIVFPIGSYHITADSTNPSDYLGGEWVAVEGRVLLGASAQYEVDSTGGSADAIIPQHRHTAAVTVEPRGQHYHSLTGSTTHDGAHNHTYAHSNPEYFTESGNNLAHYAIANQTPNITDTNGGHSHSVTGSTSQAGMHTHDVSVDITPVGESTEGANMMPYQAAYIWKRVA